MHLPEDIAANGFVANARGNSTAPQDADVQRAICARMASLRLPSHKFCAVIAE